MSVESFGRSAYQRSEKSGWILLPTCPGGFVPCWVVSLAGESEFLVVLEASVLCSSSEVMADGHLMPGRSACVRHTDTFNILLVEAIKNYCGSSSERGTEAPFAGDDTDGMLLQGPSCIFLFLKDVFITIKNYM